MERCRLCGGRLSQGRCTECGLDNTKSDRNYRLNAHNEKGTKLHEGECGAHLNRPKEPERSGKAGTAAAKRGESYRQNGGGQTKAATAKEGESYRQTGPEGDRPSEAAAARRRKRRQQTGTVKKKRLSLWKKLLLFYLVVVLFNMAENEGIWQQLGDWLSGLSGTDRMEVSDTADMEQILEAQNEEKPMTVDWDTSDPGYLELELEPGYYTVGYEIPEGTYQFQCDSGTASFWILTPQAEWWDYISLYSPEEQEYLKEMEDMEDYIVWELTEPTELESGATLCVDSYMDTLVMKGIGSGTESLELHTSQEDLTEVVLSENLLTVGEDLPAGVYDMIYEETEEYNYAAVCIESEEMEGENAVSYIFLNQEHPVFYRQKLEEGMIVGLEEFARERPVVLRPSY